MLVPHHKVLSNLVQICTHAVSEGRTCTCGRDRCNKAHVEFNKLKKETKEKIRAIVRNTEACEFAFNACAHNQG